jgi:hypothetical protein
MDDLAVGRIKKRHPVSAPIPGSVFGPPRVTLGLLQNTGGTHADFLSFDDAEEPALHEKGVVGGTAVGGVFFNGVAGERSDIDIRPVFDDRPGGVERLELPVDTFLARFPLKLFKHGSGPRSAGRGSQVG